MTSYKNPLLAVLALAPAVVWGNTALTAQADTAPAEAVRVLALSGKIDARCGYLGPSEHTELQTYAARAEISVVNSHGKKTAIGALRRAESDAALFPCGLESRDFVLQTMDAARVAANRAERRRRKVTAAARNSDDDRQRNRPSTGGLGGYRTLTVAYYTEHRCQHLTYNQANKFWKAIVQAHKSAVRNYGPGAVSRAKSEAIRTANRSNRCGARTARLVREGFASITR